MSHTFVKVGQDGQMEIDWVALEEITSKLFVATIISDESYRINELGYELHIDVYVIDKYVKVAVACKKPDHDNHFDFYVGLRIYTFDRETSNFYSDMISSRSLKMLAKLTGLI